MTPTATERRAASPSGTDVIVMHGATHARRAPAAPHLVSRQSAGALLAAAIVVAAVVELAAIVVTGKLARNAAGHWQLPVRTAYRLIEQLVAHTDWTRFGLVTAVALVVGGLGLMVARAHRGGH